MPGGLILSLKVWLSQTVAGLKQKFRYRRALKPALVLLEDVLGCSSIKYFQVATSVLLLQKEYIFFSLLRDSYHNMTRTQEVSFGYAGFRMAAVPG